MDVNKYISSGILESYVLGLASPEEARQVEAYAAQHSEIRKEIDAIREALGNYIDAHKKTPPPHLKNKILSEIDQLESRKKKQDGANDSAGYSET